MGKYGIHEGEHATVPQDLNGMETFVRRELFVQETGSTMKPFSNVCAQRSNFGMGTSVWFNLIAVVEKYGTKLPFNVTVLHPLIGMVSNVFFVLTVKSGLKRGTNVNVEREHSGMESFVLLFKNAMAEPYGTKTLGLASAIPQQFGMEGSV